MKKLSIVFCMLLLLCANSLFAAPSEAEVGEALQGVVAINATSLMQAMMGMVDNKTLKFDADMEKGSYTLTYKNFPTAGIESQLNSIALASGEEKISIPFEYMSGTISIRGGNMMSETAFTNMTINVTLKGGKVRTLFVDIKDTNKNKGSIVIKANGKTYHNAERIMEQMEKSHK